MAVVMMLTVLTISILLLRQASEHFVGEVVTNSSCILGVDVAGVGVGDVLAAGTNGAGAAADADVSDDKVDEVAGTALTSWMMQYVEHLAGVVVKTSSSATRSARAVVDVSVAVTGAEACLSLVGRSADDAGDVVVDAVDDVVNVDLGVVVAMEAEAAAVEGGGVVEDAGELRKAEGAGDGVAGTTDVVVYSSSTQWRLRSISHRILASSKAATILLTVVIAVGSSWRGRWRDG
jgi:ketosteroid isomerase-like protein